MYPESQPTPRVTIAIPTYNRSEQILLRLGEILPHLTEDVELLIIDNASDQSVLQLINAKYGIDSFAGVRVVRNVGNVGLGANVCKCFEECRGEWLWLLGDDDALADNAVSTVTQCCYEAKPDIGFVNFSTPFNRHPGEDVIQSIEGLAKLLSVEMAGNYFVSNLVYISVGCYRKDVFQSLLRFGYGMTSSHCPHFAMIMGMLLEQRAKVLLKPELPINWDRENSGRGWNPIRLMLGSAHLVEIDRTNSAVFQVVKKLINEFKYPGYMRSIALMIFGDQSKPWKYWNLFLFKMILLGRIRLKLQSLLLISLMPFAACPPIRNWLSSKIARMPGTDSTKGDERL